MALNIVIDEVTVTGWVNKLLGDKGFELARPISKKNDAGVWESTDVTAWKVTAWDKLAENVAESIVKGSPVMVSGRASWKSWEAKDGSKGGAMEITAFEVAVSLKRDPVSINKGAGRSASSNATEDPWAKPANSNDEIPF